MPGGSASPPSASQRVGSRLTEPVVPEHDESAAPDADVEAASVRNWGVVNNVKWSQQSAGRAALVSMFQALSQIPEDAKRADCHSSRPLK